MLPTTDKAYLTWARGKSLEPDTAVLASGLKIHWIGKSSAQKVFLYFHGGGYVRPMSMEHLDWLLELQTDLSKTKSVAIAAVSYTCAPEGQYPLQLRQGVESLLWLLKTPGRKPEDVSDAISSMNCVTPTDTLRADIHWWRLSRWQLDPRSFVSHVASSP
jgi:acetyl esterase/lipase